MEIVGVGGDHSLACSTGTYDHVRVDDVGRAARGEKPANVRSVDAVEGDDIGCGLTYQASKSHLAFWPANGLGQRAGRDRDSSARLARPRQQDRDATIVPIHCYESTGVERNPRRHAPEP
jgi:hypothetical protein